MDIENKYRRFEDFGLFCGLSIGLTALGVILERAFGDTRYIPAIRIASIVCVLGCVLWSLKTAFQPIAPQPWMPNRSVKERVIAFITTDIIVCLEVLVLMVVG
jgi:hypothetical protein